jgi:hypothetical protein
MTSKTDKSISGQFELYFFRAECLFGTYVCPAGACSADNSVSLQRADPRIIAAEVDAVISS